MNQVFDFFKTSMPNTRIADYHLGCLDGCVFIDLNLDNNSCIYLKRISFDGHGCCNLNDNILSLNKKESQLFIETYKKEDLNQEIITNLIIKAIELNKENIWQDALIEYGLIK